MSYLAERPRDRRHPAAATRYTDGVVSLRRLVRLDVTFCDASGLAVLIGVERRARLLGGVLRLAAPARPVAAVLRLTGLDLHFQIFATVLAAIRASAPPGVRGKGSPTRVPAGQLGVREVSDTESLRQGAIGDDDDVREAIAAVLAQADA